MKKLILLLLMFTQCGFLSAQDTLRSVSIDDLYTIILHNHPVAKQAQLLSEGAKAELLIARGYLDPKLQSTYNGKTLGGNEYYALWDHSLNIPVWWGTDLKIGYENNGGYQVNPESQTPSKGLIYAGVTIPLGQGLLIDERRNAIRQAQLLPELAEAERVKIINKLLLDATKDYWDWYYFHQRELLLEEAFQLAAKRFDAVKARFIQGDVAAIDTLEALIAMQDRDVQRCQGKLDAKNALLKISVYLWSSNGDPLEMKDVMFPATTYAAEKMDADSLHKLVNAAMMNHPDLRKLDVKQEQLAIEYKYRKDQLKPKVALRYNVLAKKPEDLSGANSSDYYTNNYKLGFSFSYPLPLRSERGKLKAAAIKQDQNELERSAREREIINEIKMTDQTWRSLNEQILLQEKQVMNATLLCKAEQERFEHGESSFFMINTRESSLISNRIKLLELEVKSEKNKAQLYWASGTLLAH